MTESTVRCSENPCDAGLWYHTASISWTIIGTRSQRLGEHNLAHDPEEKAGQNYGWGSVLGFGPVSEVEVSEIPATFGESRSLWMSIRPDIHFRERYRFYCENDRTVPGWLYRKHVIIIAAWQNVSHLSKWLDPISEPTRWMGRKMAEIEAPAEVILMNQVLNAKGHINA